MGRLLKFAGGWILWISALVLILVLMFFAIRGSVWLGEKAYPYIIWLVFGTAGICLFIFAPLSLLRSTRGASGTGFYVASFVFGFSLWVWSLLLVANIWGTYGVVIGLMLAGLGIVPLAFIAVLFHGLWSVLGQLTLVLAFTIGVRVFGLWLARKPNVET